MQISEQSREKIHFASKKPSYYKPDVLYFADSLGGMRSKDIVDTIKEFRVNWSGPLGIHAHDNLEEALSNTITSIKNGVTCGRFNDNRDGQRDLEMQKQST